MDKFTYTIEDILMNYYLKSSILQREIISMGLISRNANEIISNEEIYKKGDALLYKSKESGRNKVSVE